MAGSRLERIGTIFSRTAGLLKSGAVSYRDRPVWYDIYRVFPPKYEPHIDRQPSISVEEIPNILYKEDALRARFYKKFGLNPDGRPRRIGDPTFEDISSQFVTKCNEAQSKNPDWTSDQVFASVSEEYHATHQERRQQRVVKGEDRHASSMDVEDEDSVSSELLGRTKMTLVTPESLRELFEEARSNQKNGESEGGKGKTS